MPRKSPTEHRRIAEGFKDDCLTLLSNFKATNSARFADFQKVWQDMKFSFVYCNLNSFAEVLEFTEEALGISKQFFLPPHSDIARIGALYLLYGMYTQQPTRGLVKIRMTPEDWTQSLEFIQSIREYDYADANFIFHTLCYDAAFIFTASDKEYGFERTLRKHQVVFRHFKEMEKCHELTSNQLLKPIFQDIDLGTFEETRSHYENAKNLLKAAGQGMEFTSVTPKEDIVEILMGVADEYVSKDTGRRRRLDTSSSENSSDEIRRSPTETNIGQGRKALKQRAFKKKNRGQKHLQSCLPCTSATERPADSAERLAGASTENLSPTTGNAESASQIDSSVDWKGRHPLYRTKHTRKKAAPNCDNETAMKFAEESVDDPDEVTERRRPRNALLSEDEDTSMKDDCPP